MGLRATLVPFPVVLATAEWLERQHAWLQWRLTRPARSTTGEIRLHLGCGEIDHPGFINIDARPARHVHCLQAIDRLPQFRDDSVSLVYASHCLEHFSHRRLQEVLCEWRRVLKPGGTLRLSVPDFDLLLAAYQKHDRDMRSVVQALMGGQDYPFNYHHSSFNAEELTRVLLEAGFQSPRRWQHGVDAFTSVPDWSGRHMHYRGVSSAISLNMEADK